MTPRGRWDANLNYGHQPGSVHHRLPRTSPSWPVRSGRRCDRLQRRADLRGTPAIAITAIDGCTPLNIFEQDDPESVAQLRAAGSNPFHTRSTSQREATRRSQRRAVQPAGRRGQLAVGALYRKEYSNFDRRLDARSRSGDRHLRPRHGMPIAAAAADHDQGSLRRVAHPDPQGRAVLPCAESRPRRPLFEVQPVGSTTNSKFAVEWRPIEDLLLRGTVSEVFRAPSVSDLFAGVGQRCADCAGSLRRLHPRRQLAVHERACGAATGATDIPPGGIAQQPNAPDQRALRRVPSPQASPSSRKAARASTSAWCTIRAGFGPVAECGLLPHLPERHDHRHHRAECAEHLLQRSDQPVLRVHLALPERPDQAVLEPTVNLGRLDTSGVDFGVQLPFAAIQHVRS